MSVPGCSARLAEQLVETYLFLLQNGRVGTTSLPKALFAYLGNPCEWEEAQQHFLDLLRNLSFVHARGMTGPATRVRYWRALGIGSEGEFLACGAALLYLRRGNFILGDHFQRLPKTLQASMHTHRRHILRCLHRLLMRDLNTAFLAPGRPANVAGDMGMRAGIVAFSHLARESMTFALLESIRGPGLIDEFGRKLAATDICTATSLQSAAAECIVLLREPFAALRRDLAWFTDHSGGQGMGGQPQRTQTQGKGRSEGRQGVSAWEDAGSGNTEQGPDDESLTAEEDADSDEAAGTGSPKRMPTRTRPRVPAGTTPSDALAIVTSGG